MILQLLLAIYANSQVPVFDKRRVFIRPDGQVEVMTILKDVCLPKEADAACFERIARKDCRPKGGCYQYVDLGLNEFPEWGKRAKWRWDKTAMRIVIDNTVITKEDRLAAIEAKLDAEFEKPAQNPVLILKLMRELDIEKKSVKP